MSQQNNVLNVSLIAEADLRTKQFYFVKISGENKCNLADSSISGIGVLQNKPNTGQAAAVAVVGTTKVVAGDTITAGNLVGSNASGQAVAIEEGITRGIALESGVSGDVIEILLTTTYSVV